MEQRQNGKLNKYFKIIGIIVLLSHTFLMGIEIIYGLLSACAIFLKDVFLILLNFLKLQCIILLLIWVIIFKWLKNTDLLRIQKLLFGKQNRQRGTICQICKKNLSNEIYVECLHAFHKECLSKKYSEFNRTNICPICDDDEMKISHFLRTLLQRIYLQNTQMVKAFLLVSILYGLYRFYFHL